MVRNFDGRPPEARRQCRLTGGPLPARQEDLRTVRAVAGRNLVRRSSRVEGQPSQAFHLSGCASSHFLAASSGFMFFSAMSRATSFWSSLVHWKFFTTATAGDPESANLADTTLFNL